MRKQPKQVKKELVHAEDAGEKDLYFVPLSKCQRIGKWVKGEKRG